MHIKCINRKEGPFIKYLILTPSQTGYFMVIPNYQCIIKTSPSSAIRNWFVYPICTSYLAVMQETMLYPMYHWKVLGRITVWSRVVAFLTLAPNKNKRINRLLEWNKYIRKIKKHN